LENGERLIANLRFSYSQDKNPFLIAVSDRAIYLLRKRLFAVKDYWYAHRITTPTIRLVRINKLNPVGLWLLSIAMILLGGWTTYAMLSPLFHGDKTERTKLSGWPPALVVGGIAIPFIARKRYGIEIDIVGDSFSWKPPLMVDAASRRAIDEFLSLFARSVAEAGIPLSDDRPLLNSIETKPRERSKRHSYPMALAAGSSSKSVACYHCGGRLVVNAWDDWNGFLVECPICGKLHGKSWKPYPTLLSSIFFHGFSFFFTSRWQRAAVFGGIFALAAFVLLYLGDRTNRADDLFFILWCCWTLGPLAINSFLLIQHERDLKSSDIYRIEFPR
jgi:hypothetical protein